MERKQISIVEPIDGDSDKSGSHLAIKVVDPNRAEKIPEPTIRVKCLCFDMTHATPAVQFMLLSAGVFLFFMLCSYVEEYLFQFLPGFKYAWYLTFFELLCFAGFAAIENRARGEPVLHHNASLKHHAIVGIAMTASRGLTNLSLQYLNYPTQVILKSMKLITVMIGSVMLLRKSYTLLEYMAAILLVSSAILFSLGDVDVTPDFSVYGLVIVLISLVADSIHSNTQERLMKTYNATLSETMFYTNMFSAAGTLVVLIANKELYGALVYCHARPFAYAMFVFRALFIYAGVLCFVSLIQRFGVVLATTVTTVRKILTIICSFLLFPKPFTIKYLYAVAMFAAGVAVNVHTTRSSVLKTKPSTK